jgi:hypothetical protein
LLQLFEQQLDFPPKLQNSWPDANGTVASLEFITHFLFSETSFSPNFSYETTSVAENERHPPTSLPHFHSFPSSGF